MTRLFRGVRGDTHANYYAVGENLVSDPRLGVVGVPMGEMAVSYIPEKDTPVFNTEPEPKSTNTPYATLSRETGFTPEHIENMRETKTADSTLRNVLYDATDSGFARARMDLRYAHRLLKSKGLPPQTPQMRSSLAWNDLQEQRQRGIGLAKDVSYIRSHRQMNPYQLFTSTEPSLKVIYADFDPDVSASFPSTVALASNDFGTRTIVADADLSKHSSKLARHAAERGLVRGDDSNPDMKATNRMQFSRTVVNPEEVQKVVDEGQGQVNRGYWSHTMSPVSGEDTRKAQTTLREMLRGTKPASAPSTKLSSQFDHPMLPGTEGFND